MYRGIAAIALASVTGATGAATAQDSFGGSFGGSFEPPAAEDVAPPPAPSEPSDLVRANDMAFVAEEMRRHGYDARVVPWKPERPYVDLNRDGLGSHVFPDWCFPDRPSCLMLRFRLQLEITPPSLDVLNAWNRDNKGTRAFLDRDGVTTLMAAVFTGEDGLSREGFLRAADIWRMQIEAFTQTIGFRR